jgi:hypothetical protein
LAGLIFREYTGNTNHGCTGGCPNECAQQDDVLCYTEYKCSEAVMRPGVCKEMEGTPGGVGCEYFSSDLYMFCVACRKDSGLDPEQDVYVTHWECGY